VVSTCILVAHALFDICHLVLVLHRFPPSVLSRTEHRFLLATSLLFAVDSIVFSIEAGVIWLLPSVLPGVRTPSTSTSMVVGILHLVAYVFIVMHVFSNASSDLRMY
jgi:hypothetical protein